MIDTINATFHCPGVSISNVSFVRVFNGDGHVTRERTNRSSVPGRYGYHQIQLRYDRRKGLLEIECSLPGVLQGHNVYGSNNMIGLFTALLPYVEAGLDAPFDGEAKARWLAGDIRLNRVDIANSFDYKNEAQVNRVLAAIRSICAASGDGISTAGTTVCWNHYEDFHASCYGKAAEMRASRRLERFRALRDLNYLFSGYLRIEVRMRKTDLRAQKIDSVTAWKSSTARDQFLRVLKLSPIVSQDCPEFPEGMTSSMEKIYDRFKAGIKMKLDLSKGSWRKYYVAFMKIKIDISKPCSLAFPGVPTLQHLQDKLVREPPTKIIAAGLFFDPPKGRPRMRIVTTALEKKPGNRTRSISRVNKPLIETSVGHQPKRGFGFLPRYDDYDHGDDDEG